MASGEKLQVGVTDEFHQIGLYLKRARATEVHFGNATRRWPQLSGC
jgi:hypothetical protein